MTPALMKLLSRNERNSGNILAISITGTGPTDARRLQILLDEGYAQIVPHPSIRDTSGDKAADALTITDTGRAALEAATGDRS